ncbi:MAG: maleylpyruvate isomerase N-terminal domain-containing protein [Bacteroidota bacterium]
MEKLKRIDVVDLLPSLDSLLIKLLEGLDPKDWDRQTIAPQWKVKDVAVHLLDGNLRTLSMLRDRYYGEPAEHIHSYQDLVHFLNQLNADWVKATRRLSPRVIIDLLKTSGQEYCQFLSTLNPGDKAEFSVAWAGEQLSQNWFHIAREYTEKWHHQQQIRLAVQKEDVLLKHQWYFPYLDTSIRALPHHYRDTAGKPGEVIKFRFIGETEKNWFLCYDGGWQLATRVDEKPVCEVSIADEYAWRIFTKGMKKEKAIKSSKIVGKQELGLRIFDMIAVMA